MAEKKLPSVNEISDILIVCAGNVCRSPMAEAALRAKIYERGIDGIRVHSAGTSGGNIPTATSEAILTVERRQLDLTAHRSRQLTRDMMEEADVVLAMDRDNLRWILTRWPEFEDKTHLVTSFRGDKWTGSDVEDPYGFPIEFYESTFDLIDFSLEAFVDRLSESGG